MGRNTLEDLIGIDNPDAAMYLILKDKKMHIAYSENLDGNYDEMLDILESAALILMLSADKDSSNSESVH